MRAVCLFLIAVAIQIEPSLAQHTHAEQSMPGMSNQDMSKDNMPMESHSLIELLQHHATAGTDAQPNSTPSPMLMTMKGKWTLMFHGEAFLNDIQQTGPRGADGSQWSARRNPALA